MRLSKRNKLCAALIGDQIGRDQHMDSFRLFDKLNHPVAAVIVVQGAHETKAILDACEPVVSGWEATILDGTEAWDTDDF